MGKSTDSGQRSFGLDAASISRLKVSTLQGLRAAIASVLAVLVADRLHLNYPVYAVIAAIVVIDPSVEKTMQMGWLRIVATAVGAGFGFLGAHFFPGNLVVMGVLIVIMTALCSAFNFEGGAKVAAYTPALILLSFSTAPLHYSLYRLAETGIGIASGVLVSIAFELIVVIHEHAVARPKREPDRSEAGG